MAYKKYIERNGKLYGPYLYESKRIDGKVVSSYHGRKNTVPLLSSAHHIKHKNTNKLLRFLIPLVIITLLLIFVVPKLNPTGNVVMNLNGDYMEGQILSGTLDIKLNQGEFLPADSKIIIQNNEQTYEFLLNKLTNAPLELGNFYIQNTEISGQGEGYGVPGSQTQAERVYFKLASTTEAEETEIPIEETPVENETQPEESPELNNTEQTAVENETSTESENNPEQTVEIPTEPVIEQPTEETPTENENIAETESEAQIEETQPAIEPPVAEPQLPVTEQTGGETTIAGNIVRGFTGGISKFFLALSPTGNAVSSTEEISKDLTYPEELTYKLKKGETIKLVSGSVTAEVQKINDSYIQLEKEGEIVKIKTSYYNSTTGFGSNYIQDQLVSFPIDLTKLNISLEKGDLEIKLVYGDTEIESIKTKLDENATIGIVEKPIKEENVSLTPEQNATVPEEAKLQKLTTNEKATLLENFGNTTIKQEAKNYRDWIIVKFTLGSYQIEHSYQTTLDSTELEYYIERDKINWLKDIAYTLEESTSASTPLTNYTKSENLF